MRRPVRFVPAAVPLLALPLLLLAWAGGCASVGRRANATTQAVKPRVQALDLSGAAPVLAPGGPVALYGARNEWLSFAVELSDLPPGRDYTLRLRPPRLQGGDAVLSADAFEAHQVLAMPVDVNRAGYVRHTGLSAAISQ